MMKFWHLIVCMVLSFGSYAQQTVDLYMIEGAVFEGFTAIPYFTFNRTTVFDSSNAVLQFKPGDQVTFNVHNTLDFTTGFEVLDHGSIDRIAAGEFESITITFDEAGTYLYQDPTNDHRALGLGGMIVVTDFEGPTFYGVFTEHCTDWIEPISEGGTYDRRSYSPDFFSINGKEYPATLRDSLSMIMGHVGDTIHIHMTNAGMMYHFPHFHGYHVTILQASEHPQYEGWSKDSFGMAPGESIVVELIPDKPGRYPMHNHNLVTTTTGGNYPGGMMMHMHIHE